MKFIKKEDNTWWELDEEHKRLYNINNGWHTVSNEYLLDKQLKECNDWHELYTLTNYDPLVDNQMWHCGWISPNGDFYPCEAHEVDAECIYKLLYGEDVCYYSDELILKGWKKVTNSLMFDIYKNNGDYDKFYSNQQKTTFNNWINQYNM